MRVPRHPAVLRRLVAGIAAGSATREPDPVEEGAKVAVTQFSFAFFIPVYFAVVGLQLDLLHNFSVLFFLGYLAFACLVETISVYAGARFGGQRPAASVNLAVAMNARGGPGIVLASVAYGAGIINQSFYAILVLLAIVTSLLAGSWLDRVPRDQLLSPATSPLDSATEEASLERHKLPRARKPAAPA